MSSDKEGLFLRIFIGTGEEDTEISKVDWNIGLRSFFSDRKIRCLPCSVTSLYPRFLMIKMSMSLNSLENRKEPLTKTRSYVLEYSSRSFFASANLAGSIYCAPEMKYSPFRSGNNEFRAFIFFFIDVYRAFFS